MKVVAKYTTVCEFVPKGYDSWTAYYFSKEKRERIFNAVMPWVAALILVAAFAVVGTLEAAV